jgi:hypothetical protein
MSGKPILQIKKFVFHFTLQSRLVEGTSTVLGNLVWATSQPKGAPKWRWNRLDTVCLHNQLIRPLSFSMNHKWFQFSSKFIKDRNISFLPTQVTLISGWRHNINTARDILGVNLYLALEKSGCWLVMCTSITFLKILCKIVIHTERN